MKVSLHVLWPSFRLTGGAYGTVQSTFLRGSSPDWCAGTGDVPTHLCPVCRHYQVVGEPRPVTQSTVTGSIRPLFAKFTGVVAL